MPKHVRRRLVHAAIATAIVGAGPLAGPSVADEPTVSSLAGQTHFHGIAFDRTDPSRIHLATHHGFYRVTPDGSAHRISTSVDDFMGFTPHPADPTLLYASGHPASGGNLGFLRSADGGKTWVKLSDGSGGPVDFHQMDVSKADPAVIYGVYGGLQRSLDSGRSWWRLGPAPDGLICLAASAKDRDTLYAATSNGLLRSTDAGRTWRPAHPIVRPTTLVYVARDGGVFAFIVGWGLVRAAEPDLGWQPVSNAFGDAYLLHLDVDPKRSGRIVAVKFEPKTRTQSVIASVDAGRTWAPLGKR